MHISWQVHDFVDVEVQSWWPVAGAGLSGPWSADFVAGAGLFVDLEMQTSWQV